VLGKDAIQGLTFHAAVPGDAVEIKDDREGQAGIGFDLLVEFEERALKDLSEQGA